MDHFEEVTKTTFSESFLLQELITKHFSVWLRQDNSLFWGLTGY